MKKTLLAAALASAVAAPAFAQTAPQSPWQIRVRAVNLGFENKSEAGSGALTPALLPSDSVRANDKTIPEVDVTYFFTKNIAAELVLTVPQKHNVSIVNGPLREGIGSFKHLPPTLLLQYHFLPDAQFRPYVGAGINYTKISSVNLFSNVAGQRLTLDGSSVGASVQVGMDIPITKNVLFNLDVKKTYIDTDIKINGGKVSKLELNPLMLGVGLGYRF